MRAGPLRDRVEIQALSTVREAGGGADPSYGTVATRWAAVEPYSARERVTAGQVQGRALIRVRLRYYDGLTSAHRFKFGDRVLNILGVYNPDGMKIEHVCECVEKV